MGVAKTLRNVMGSDVFTIVHAQRLNTILCTPKIVFVNWLPINALCVDLLLQTKYVNRWNNLSDSIVKLSSVTLSGTMWSLDLVS